MFKPEIDAQGFGVSYVQITVGLGRETGVDLKSLILAAGRQILFNECIDEIFPLSRSLLIISSIKFFASISFPATIR